MLNDDVKFDVAFTLTAREADDMQKTLNGRIRSLYSFKESILRRRWPASVKAVTLADAEQQIRDLARLHAVIDIAYKEALDRNPSRATKQNA